MARYWGDDSSFIRQEFDVPDDCADDGKKRPGKNGRRERSLLAHKTREQEGESLREHFLLLLNNEV
jgi:hypothetical protein